MKKKMLIEKTMSAQENEHKNGDTQRDHAGVINFTSDVDEKIRELSAAISKLKRKNG